MALKMNKEGKLGCQKIEAVFNIHVSSSLTSFSQIENKIHLAIILCFLKFDLIISKKDNYLWCNMIY